MKYVLTVLVILSTCMNLHASENNQSLEDKIESIVDKNILNQIENVNSAIANNLIMLEILLAVIGIAGLVFGFINLYQKRQLMIEMDEKITQYVDKRFYAQSEEMYKNISKKLIFFVKSSTTELKKEFQEEEFLRNLIFYDLSKMLSSELNNGNNIAEVFSTYSERYYLVTQLTSGTNEKRIRALKRLRTGTYKHLPELQSCKDYITFLKKSDIDIDVLNQIEQLDLD